MRICFDGRILGNHSGGNESHCLNVIKNFDLDKFDLYVPIDADYDVSEFNKKIVFIKYKSKNAFVRNFIELPRICKEYKIDILHTQYYIPFKSPCKVVCTIHDICQEHFKNILTLKDYIKTKLLVPYAAKHSDLVFTVSNFCKEDISKYYHISDSNIITIYNGVSDDFRKLSEKEINLADLKCKFGISSDIFIIGVGNLQPRKNFARLVKAFIKYKNIYKDDLQLVIVGKKSWMYSDIFKEAKDYMNSIIFTDYVSDVDLVRLYNAAKALIFPSFFEGFGIPPLEAFACGTPVACSNTASIPEVVGNAGVYFDPYDVDSILNGIIKVLNYEYLTSNVKFNMNKQVEKYSWIKTTRIIEKNYYSLI